jgi:GTP-binding protein
MSYLKIALVGRPNVGKSTLFNRLAGKRMAIVEDMPGVTRDRRYAQGVLFDLDLDIVDTAGLSADSDQEILNNRMRQQTEIATKEADAILFLVDGKTGILPEDKEIANWLRRQSKPVILLINKSEGKNLEAYASEAYKLGMGDPICISAEHGQGMEDIYNALLPHASEFSPEIDEKDKPLQIAIVGRPNAGKSTLINQAIGEDRLVTSEIAGTTRDAIPVDFQYKDKSIRLVDTAGLRRRSRIHEKVESLSVSETMRSIQYAEVVLLVVDATCPLEKQDLTIARRIVDEGRALVLVLNKIDLVDDLEKLLKDVKNQLKYTLSQIKDIKILHVSALSGKNFHKIFDVVFQVYETWQTRISTGKLNRWLEYMIDRNPPPLSSGRRIKMRYMTQIKTRPPTFVIFVSKPTNLPDSYLRYLTNNLRDDFDLDGVPIRIYMRKGDNPYAKD